MDPSGRAIRGHPSFLCYPFSSQTATFIFTEALGSYIIPSGSNQQQEEVSTKQNIITRAPRLTSLAALLTATTSVTRLNVPHLANV